MVDYIQLSNYIIMTCNKSGKSISNKKLQKIMFYCQAYHIAKYKEDLISNDFEAWKHGAVLPVLWREYSCYGYNDIYTYDENEYNNIRHTFGEYLCDFLDRVIGKFSFLSADEIEEINHNELPWQEARKGYAPNENCNNIISKSSINNYYSQLLCKEGKMDMKVKKVSIKSKKLLMAKKRLAERKLTVINEDNKNEYYETIYNEVEEMKECTWRAMNGK